ncbi:hypothetical protein FACS1894103_0700 [Campylobacterota bacterium]|nr:hypothetical protein FACS1894103_0410 [Campylobacterota bacterium]GHV58723.1 hypothetical protein FACS1894103_0700 [Campylobacterota bacterium]
MTFSDGYKYQPFNDSDNTPCPKSGSVEWGGGASGIYYERLDANYCGKSNDEYVRDHAAETIVVRPLHAESGYTIKLSKPMRFANKTSLVTFDMAENREYICYGDAEPCKPPNEF